MLLAALAFATAVGACALAPLLAPFVTPLCLGCRLVARWEEGPAQDEGEQPARQAATRRAGAELAGSLVEAPRADARFSGRVDREA